MWIEKDIRKRLKTVVILCAGEGRRLLHLGKDTPKALVKINNRPMMGYVIDYCRPFAREFIFVVHHKKEQIVSYAVSEGLTVPFRFVEQERLLGIANAISCVEQHVDGEFLVVLADCLCKGAFAFPDSFTQGVGVWENGDEYQIKLNWSIELEGGFMKKVIEKPKVIINNLCGMGYYFLEKRVFGYIRQTPPSSLRNEIEITDVIQRMIDSGEKISPLFLKGEFINITSPQDIEKASRIFNRAR